MPKAKKPVENEMAPASMPQSEKDMAIDVTPAADHIDIIDEAGNLVRTYSLEVHGENFANLADQYIAGHPNCHKQ